MASKFASLAAMFAVLVSQPPAAKAFIVPPAPGSVNALMDCVDDHLDLFNADSRGAPAAIAASLSGDGARLVFQTCRDSSHNTHYFVRAPHSHKNGVCRTFQEEIFPAADRIR